jgi:hypothetical protein
MTGSQMDSTTRTRLAGAAAALLLVPLLACAAPQRQPRTIRAVPLTESLRAGLDLYAADEFGRAGAQFRAVSRAAGARSDRDLAHRSMIAECTSWLRARRMQEFCSCAGYLEESQRRMRTSDSRVNTLIALSALAEGKPLPSLRTPSAVRVVLRDAAEER